ncbi:MAG: hypothetical protein GWN55_03650 [Phycisphaerae bacterium]|nr:hypothetical protein [Phycisphaerae bacterium]NIV00418.1 hypothetical protein [Phycisphaerae bacterium]NIV70449.1 hypothetical protein [Phycisphaerae bacterium]NIX01314.1 hypothetical protein [Phycisphaerae bacterium]
MSFGSLTASNQYVIRSAVSTVIALPRISSNALISTLLASGISSLACEIGLTRYVFQSSALRNRNIDNINRFINPCFSKWLHRVLFWLDCMAIVRDVGIVTILELDYRIVVPPCLGLTFTTTFT